MAKMPAIKNHTEAHGSFVAANMKTEESVEADVSQDVELVLQPPPLTQQEIVKKLKSVCRRMSDAMMGPPEEDGMTYPLHEDYGSLIMDSDLEVGAGPKTPLFDDPSYSRKEHIGGMISVLREMVKAVELNHTKSGEPIPAKLARMLPIAHEAIEMFGPAQR